MPRIPYESLDDSSDSLESTDEPGTRTKMDQTSSPKEKPSCSDADNRNDVDASKTSDNDGELALVRPPSETKLDAIPQLRKKHKSEIRMKSFTLPPPPLTKQPNMNYLEAPASEWSRFILDSANFNFQSDMPTSSGTFLGRERLDRSSRFDHNQRRMRSGIRWDIGTSISRQDTAQVIRRLRLRFNSMSRKQGLLEQVNAQFSEEIKQIRGELNNCRQSANEERDILRQQLIQLQECVKQANVAEKQRDMLLTSISELRDNVKALQQSFDGQIEERLSHNKNLLTEKNNLLNEMKTIQDENRQLHKALNLERSKLQRNRQILMRRNDHRLALKHPQCKVQQPQQRNNLNDETTAHHPLQTVLEQQLTEEPGIPEKQNQCSLPEENNAEIQRIAHHLPDVAIPLTGASISSNSDEDENLQVHESNNETVPELCYKKTISGPARFAAACCRYKMLVLYTAIIILAIFLGTFLPVPWRM